MNKIFKLPKNLISKIAAGEVVERPASVVKELIENSIDAGANDISINIEEGGKKSISIIDNGEGMIEEDALNCFNLHTTSKIIKEEDLDNILTFGFRGEALASICSISETTIHTSNLESKPIKLIIENSELIDKQNVPRVQGTTITIKDIFRHLPARKKFLKTDSTEYRHCNFEISKIALSKPHIRIKFSHNNKTILDLPKANSMKSRVLSLFKELKDKDIIDLNVSNPGISINGYIIHPSKLSTDNTKQYLFLNDRYVIDRTLNKAIKDGYGTTISREKQPIFFLKITLDPKRIDVNIHPRKLEVKIDNIQNLYQTLKYSVEKKLSTELKSELNNKFYEFSNPSTSNFNPTSKIHDNNEILRNNIKDSFVPKNYQTLPRTFSKPTINAAMEFSKTLLSPEFEENNTSQIKFFQIFDTYLIIEKEEKIIFIDQHAAHERINYEKFLRQLKENKKVQTQSLLLPIEVILDEDTIEQMEQRKKYLIDNTGIDYEITSSNTISIKSQPSSLSSINFKNLINEILTSIENTCIPETDEYNHKLAAILACHNSIRAGRKMYPEEAIQLVNDLFNCNNPYSCPHGRPVIWELTKYDIETKFERKK
ncbi:DNA mismatch repair endonuclease MutL [Candidatus Dojkabacteria bacterium]|nr:DNA mismatch repair endonuclease MutL [Candidatus Dojkabacteria bacterium]